MISDRQLADAILARIPEGVTSFEIARKTDGPFAPHWRVTMHDDAMLERHDCVSEVDPALSSALAKANVSLFRKREQIAAQASNVMVFTPKGLCA